MSYNCDDCEVALDCDIVGKAPCQKSFIDECKALLADKAKLKEDLEAANHDYEELMKERTDYVAENKRLRKLLHRAKKTFEPFPICSDLRSMAQRLREKHTETEVEAIKKGFAKHQEKFRKLYRDIEQALKGK